MAYITVTYTFVNSTTASATEVNQNFTDLINGTSDGTKDFAISALTVGGAALFNGAVTLGNASGDDITFTGSLASTIPIKTNVSFNFGDSTHGLGTVYFGNSTFTVGLVAGALSGSSKTVTIQNITGTMAVQDAALTEGSIPFINASLQLDENNANLFWDNTNFRLGIETASPSYTIDADVTDAGANDRWIAIQNTTNGNLDVGFKAVGFGSSGIDVFYRNDDTSARINAAGASTYLAFDINGTLKFFISNGGSLVPGVAGLATNATDGFVYLPTCAGAPTGTPTAFSARAACVYDSTNNKLYVYNGAWKSVTLA